MNRHFPPLSDASQLQKRVVLFAPHPDDEVLGAGGMLAFHARRGDEVRVIVATDGAAGAATAAEREALRAKREDESRRAAAVLGVSDVRFLALEDGALGSRPDLVAKLSSELESFGPELVYAPSPFEYHPDHRALCSSLCAALANGAKRRVFFYGVNVPLAAGVLFDVTRSRGLKRAALECFASQSSFDLAARADAADRARTINVDLPGVEAIEGFAECSSDSVRAFHDDVVRLRSRALEPKAAGAADDLFATTAVITTWNKVDDLCQNLDGLRAQTRPFAEVIVVDNCSKDATVRVLADRYPEVRVVSMPHSAYGACETFNIGFASAHTPLVAILDDDVVLPPHWLEKTVERLKREPETTAIVSSEIEEPDMPPGYLEQEHLKRERYMSTFRGCASLARLDALKKAGYYDERLYIYGNERDLTCRLLNLGYRVLQYPDVRAFHKTPFGIKMGKRSLYFHARNAWLTQLKYAPAGDLARLPFLVLTKVLLRGEKKEAAGKVADATGTIGIGKSIRETPGAWWVLVKASFNVLANVPYCWKHRAPCKASDFELPLS